MVKQSLLASFGVLEALEDVATLGPDVSLDLLLLQLQVFDAGLDAVDARRQLVSFLDEVRVDDVTQTSDSGSVGFHKVADLVHLVSGGYLSIVRTDDGALIADGLFARVAEHGQ